MNVTSSIRSQFASLLSIVAVLAGFGLTTQAWADEYQLVVTTNRSNISVWCNGFPVKAATPVADGDIVTTTALLNPYLFDGKNQLFLRMERLQDSREDEAFSATVQLEARAEGEAEFAKLIVLERAEEIALGTRTERFRMQGLAEVADRWTFNEATPGTTVTVDMVAKSLQTNTDASEDPPEIRLIFDADVPAPSLPWLSPKPVLVQADRDTMVAAITALHAAMDQKNTAQVVTQLASKSDRLAIALGTTRPIIDARLMASFDFVFGIDAFAMTAINPAAFVVEEFPGINLFRVLEGAVPALRATGTDFEFSTHIYFSKINDAWVVVD